MQRARIPRLERAKVALEGHNVTGRNTNQMCYPAALILTAQ